MFLRSVDGRKSKKKRQLDRIAIFLQMQNSEMKKRNKKKEQGVKNL